MDGHFDRDDPASVQLLLLVAGVWRQLLHIGTPAPDAPKIPSPILVLFNGFLAVVALVACFGLLLAAPK
jgi:hypothetical protein